MGKINSQDYIIRLVQQYQNLIFSVCLRLTGDYFVAEDITQETFLSAYEHLEEFDGDAEKAWLCRIAANKCIDYKREAARRTVAMAEEDLPPDPTEPVGDEPLKAVLNKELMHRVGSACEALEPAYRSVARMYFLEGKTAREISERTGIGIKTIQTRIYRAREMLRKSIRKEELLG